MTEKWCFEPWKPGGRAEGRGSAAVQIVVNGQARALEPGTTVAALVASLDLGGRRMAVEIDEEVVPRSEYAERVLGDGERVEIVHAVGGG